MKKIIYLLIPIMVLFVACGNKTVINFDNQEEVCKAWSDWANQSKENKEALLKNAKEMINAKIAEKELCKAKKDSACAAIDAKWVELEASTDIEAQKTLLDEIKTSCKKDCAKKDAVTCAKACAKKNTAACAKACAKKDSAACAKVKEGCCKEMADWDNLTPEKKAELIQKAIEKHNAKKVECENKKADCATKKAEFDTKWNGIDNKELDEQKAIIDEIFAACPEKSCCKKNSEEKK